MNRLFGRRSPSSATAASDSDVLAEIAETRRLNEKREEHLQRKVQSETADALKAKAAGNKQAALAALKRKKMHENEISSLFEQRVKLDSQEHTLQSLKFTKATVATERRATEAIRAQVKELGGTEALEDQRAKLEETLEDAYELLGVAAEPMSNPALGGATDEELLAELEEEEERARLLHVDTGSSSSAAAEFLSLPTPPKALTQHEQDERDLAELDQLAASMNLAVEQPMPMPMRGLAHTCLVAERPMPMLGMSQAVMAM